MGAFEAWPSIVWIVLLKQFAETGIPERISSDNASNFTSSLTREFLEYCVPMGCCSPQ